MADESVHPHHRLYMRWDERHDYCGFGGGTSPGKAQGSDVLQCLIDLLVMDIPLFQLLTTIVWRRDSRNIMRGKRNKPSIVSPHIRAPTHPRLDVH
jgi:hypothetical protein